MKHKHCDMIFAKAENMQLIQFVYCHHYEKWRLCAGQEDVRFVEGGKYFLCLPKHKEACLYALNNDVSVELYTDGLLYGRGLLVGGNWGDSDWYMRDDLESRVKPKKEKRWIYISDNGYIGGAHFESVDELKSRVHAPNGFYGWQFIEIEVEV